MKMNVKKGIVKADNCHDKIKFSFCKFLGVRKRGIFTFVDADFSDDEFSAKFAATYDTEKYTVANIKKMLPELKKQWRESNHYEHAGFVISGLKERGWTTGAISKFLGDCDVEMQNPYYSSSAPMKLYRVERVLKAENSNQWQIWYESSLEKRAKQSKISKEIAKNKRLELIKQVNAMTINIPLYKIIDLKERAINHYNDLMACRGKEQRADMSDDEAFLDRLSVNYLRHGFNGYDERLERMSGLIGNNDAYFILKNKILDAITEKYPHLKTACESKKISIKQPS